MTTYSFFLLSFGLVSSVQPNNEVNYQLPKLTVVFTIFVFFYEALYLTSQMFLTWKEKYDEQEGYLNKYLAIVVFFQMALATAIVALEGMSYGV